MQLIVQILENGSVEVSAVDPAASMMSVKNESLGGLASEIGDKLKKVIDHL